MDTLSNEFGDYSILVPSHWSGSITPTKIGYSFTPSSKSYTNLVTHQLSQNFTAVEASFTLTVQKAGTGSGTVTSNPAGIDCGSDCSEIYPASTPVSLTATPAAGSVFAGWSSNCPGGVVTMTANMSCIATFNLQPDAYEPDNSSTQAKVISHAVIQNHNIMPANDVDWVKFTLAANSGIKIESSGTTAANTRLWLYNSSLGLIEANDNISTTNLYSRIDRICGVDSLPAGTYYAKVDENGNNSIIPSYRLSLRVSPCLAKTFTSQASYDGWVLESSETSNRGGTANATGTTFYVGDYTADKQYRGILSFDTSALPDNAVITKVSLKILRQTTAGTNPFTTHGSLLLDIRKGSYNNPALELVDFQAAASKTAGGAISSTPVSNWYSATLAAANFPYMNLAGLTQFRLRFTKDDNDDMAADYLAFYSGNATASYRPVLTISYYVP
jgi:hypothetical protein